MSGADDVALPEAFLAAAFENAVMEEGSP